MLEVVPGKRTQRQVRTLIQAAQARTEGRMMRLLTSDEYKAYRTEILSAYGIQEEVIRTGKPGRPRNPRTLPPPDLLYATVHKRRRNGRVVNVETRRQFGTEERLKEALSLSSIHHTVNTSYIERFNGTDRHRNSRKARKTYRFSKDWDQHNASTYFTVYSANFCCPVYSLRQPTGEGTYRPQTPAMAAGLTDHIWSMEEWCTFPAKIQ